MDRWQYHVHQYEISDRWGSKRQAQELEKFNTTLTQMGDQGWELISYNSIPVTGAWSDKIKGYAYLLFWKRKVVQA